MIPRELKEITSDAKKALEGIVSNLTRMRKSLDELNAAINEQTKAINELKSIINENSYDIQKRLDLIAQTKALAGSGYSNEQIAEELGIPESSVRAFEKE